MTGYTTNDQTTFWKLTHILHGKQPVRKVPLVSIASLLANLLHNLCNAQVK